MGSGKPSGKKPTRQQIITRLKSEGKTISYSGILGSLSGAFGSSVVFQKNGRVRKK